MNSFRPPGFPVVEAPEILYHYTDERGLLGIVESGSIWATSIYHLNDRREFDHARELIDQRLTERKAKLDDMEQQTVLASIQLALEKLEARLPIFVTAFSRDPDVLSQWRAYGNLPGGYAIGFDTTVLLSNVSGRGVVLGRCEYDDSLVSEPFETLIDGVLSEYERLKGLMPEPGKTIPEPTIVQNLQKRFSVVFAEMAPFLKHMAFREEAEWRLFVGDVAVDSELLPYRFRPGGTSVVPYIEVPFGGREAIREIWIGPTAQEDRPRVEAAVRLLTDWPESDVKIRFSPAPFRP